MKPNPLTLFYLLILLLSLGNHPGTAGLTNVPPALIPPPTVKTNFIKDAQLSAAEVKQVLELARRCGIADPAEVSTFQYIPVGGRGINVKSTDRIDSRSTFFDSLTISKDGWGGLDFGVDTVQVGKFSAKKDSKSNTHLRRYEFKRTPIQVVIGNGVDVILADKVIPLILSKTVQLENDWARQQFEELKDAKPTTIRKSDSDKDYELWFEEEMKIVRFKMKQEKVIITGVSLYVI